MIIHQLESLAVFIVDGKEILYQFHVVDIPVFIGFLYIPGGAGFLPSTVLRLVKTIFQTGQNL